MPLERGLGCARGGRRSGRVAGVRDATRRVALRAAACGEFVKKAFEGSLRKRHGERDSVGYTVAQSRGARGTGSGPGGACKFTISHMS